MKLRKYIKKITYLLYGKDKEKIKTDQAKSFEDQKGKGYINLPIALSKIYTNNSSKELINNIKQLINDLYDTKQITKQVYKKLHNKLINFSKFDEEYNKCVDNIVKFEYYKSEKEPGTVSLNQKKMRRYARDLKDIVDLYNLKSDSDTSKKGEGLKILTNKQMLNCLPILLARTEAGNNSIKIKYELRQILYSLYRSNVLTKTVYNDLIKSIRA